MLRYGCVGAGSRRRGVVGLGGRAVYGCLARGRGARDFGEVGGCVWVRSAGFEGYRLAIRV